MPPSFADTGVIYEWSIYHASDTRAELAIEGVLETQKLSCIHDGFVDTRINHTLVVDVNICQYWHISFCLVVCDAIELNQKSRGASTGHATSYASKPQLLSTAGAQEPHLSDKA